MEQFDSVRRCRYEEPDVSDYSDGYKDFVDDLYAEELYYEALLDRSDY